MEGVLKSRNAGKKKLSLVPGGWGGELTAQRFSSVLLPVDDIQPATCRFVV